MYVYGAVIFTYSHYYIAFFLFKSSGVNKTRLTLFFLSKLTRKLSEIFRQGNRCGVSQRLLFSKELYANFSVSELYLYYMSSHSIWVWADNGMPECQDVGPISIVIQHQVRMMSYLRGFRHFVMTYDMWSENREGGRERENRLNNVTSFMVGPLI